jgi:hypothetical protein
MDGRCVHVLRPLLLQLYMALAGKNGLHAEQHEPGPVRYGLPCAE